MPHHSLWAVFHYGILIKVSKQNLTWAQSDRLTVFLLTRYFKGDKITGWVTRVRRPFGHAHRADTRSLRNMSLASTRSSAPSRQIFAGLGRRGHSKWKTPRTWSWSSANERYFSRLGVSLFDSSHCARHWMWLVEPYKTWIWPRRPGSRVRRTWPWITRSRLVLSSLTTLAQFIL